MSKKAKAKSPEKPVPQVIRVPEVPIEQEDQERAGREIALQSRLPWSDHLARNYNYYDD